MKSLSTAVLAALLLAACAPQAKQSSPTPATVKQGAKMEQNNTASLEQIRNRCRSMLYKVESRDDLIKQMYATAFEDDCLFAMYESELREIWQIPVILEYDSRIQYMDLPSPIGLYVVISNSSFQTDLTIWPTKKYLEEKGSIFPENRFPDFLPEPMTKEMPEGLYSDYEYFSKRKPEDPIQERLHYYWRKNGREIVAANSGSGAIETLSFYSNLKMSPMGR